MPAKSVLNAYKRRKDASTESPCLVCVSRGDELFARFGLRPSVTSAGLPEVGEIPPDLGRLEALQSLDLSGNNLEGMMVDAVDDVAFAPASKCLSSAATAAASAAAVAVVGHEGHGP